MAEIAEFGPRKTIYILAIVAGCFAVLWPKIFYPMLTASVIPQPASSDSTTCCDVIFESDVNTVDILQEMCRNIVTHHRVDPRVRDALMPNKLTPSSANLCKEEVLARCGIDLSSFLAEHERVGKSYKQVLEEIRSFNSSICLKKNFGVPLSQLGTPHLIRYHILLPHSTIRQERRTPPHAGGLHPALRERGRAIPASHVVPKVKDRPDHVAVPKIRPPMGGAGHVVPPPKGNGTMGIIMPLYTLGIVLFFLYTVVKVLKKNGDGDVSADYPGSAAETEFRKMVFSPETLTSAVTGTLYRRKKERSLSPPHLTPSMEELKDQAAGDIEIDQLRRRLVETEAAMERIVAQMGNLSCSVTHSPSPQPEAKDIATCNGIEVEDKAILENGDETSPTVKIMGMETTASCEGGQKWSRPGTPVIPPHQSNTERAKTPPKPIYLEGALPSQCELLVTDSETQAEQSEEDVEAPVVLSGKMTLSLISLDQIPTESESNDKAKENGIGESHQRVEKEEGKNEQNEVKAQDDEVEIEEIEMDEDEEVEEEEIEEEEVEEEEYEVEEDEDEEDYADEEEILEIGTQSIEAEDKEGAKGERID